MQVAGRLVMVSVQKRVSNHAVTISCFLFMAVATVFLFGAAVSPLMLLGFAPFFGGGYGIVSIVRPVVARDILGEHHFGTKSGVLAMVYLCGAASSPWIGSLIWSFGGYDALLPFLMILALAGMGLYILAHRSSQSAQRSRHQ